jgi:nucleotidyltransferase/DNA polymerase involved in DNA repair
MKATKNIPNTQPQPTKNSWAFAKDMGRRAGRLSRKSRQLLAASQQLNRCIITACSHEARQFGVRVGMSYRDALSLIPDMKIIIYNR